ncbi:MAG: hypothetical protein ABJG78_21210 [Cyclobacteriaceae bacterium]
MENSAHFKETLVNTCVQMIEEKLANIDKELVLVQKSANEETKSSAGDKYETGRAMLMLEKEKLLGQKEQLLNQLKPLKSIDSKKVSDKVELGAIIQTTGNKYFISSALGQIELGKDSYFVISAMAPIAQAMLGKQVGETFAFNKTSFEITEIY